MKPTIKSAVDIANAAKQARNALPVRDDLFAKAWRRVQASPCLLQYEDELLAGPDDDDHLRWVVSAKVSDLVNWADSIRRDRNEEI